MTEHKNVFMALAAAQMEMEPVVKGAINPAFKGEGKPKGTPYADLADVLVAVLPALNKNGLALFHYATTDGERRSFVTALVHGASETRIECPVELILGKMDMQGYKSAVTYAKRIGTESVTGVAPTDDDGNAAAATIQDSRLLSADQFLTLRSLLEEARADEARFCGFFKIGTLEELPVGKFAAAEAMLVQKIAQNPAKVPADA